MPKHLMSMARSSPRLVLAIVAMLVTLALASAGRSEQALMWTEKEDGGLTMLSYGPLDPAQNPLFVLSCFSGMNIVVLDVHREIPDAKPGDPLTIELSSAKAQSPVKGEVGKNETTGKTFGEAVAEDKDRVSHRGKAFARLREFLVGFADGQGVRS